jgi:hypothetical protein
MANKVLLKRSSVGGKAPTTADLDYGELSINYADGLLYYKTSTNTINVLNASSTYGNTTVASYLPTYNGTIGASNITVQVSGTTISTRSAAQATVATTTTTAVDTWSTSTYRSAKYIVQIKQGSDFSVHEILVIQDGTTTYKTEYGIIETNSTLAAFSADISSGNARLLVTMISAASATINISRELIAA